MRQPRWCGVMTEECEAALVLLLLSCCLHKSKLHPAPATPPPRHHALFKKQPLKNSQKEIQRPREQAKQGTLGKLCLPAPHLTFLPHLSLMLLYLIGGGATWRECEKPVSAEKAASGRSAWPGDAGGRRKKKVGSTRGECSVDTDAAKQRAE